MFLRLIGEEGAALSSTAANPFADTPAWCDRYVAYAYEKGYTKGNNISAGGQRYFGPDAQLSAGEYMTFLLRALGYSDSGASPDFSWALESFPCCPAYSAKTRVTAYGFYHRRNQ